MKMELLMMRVKVKVEKNMERRLSMLTEMMMIIMVKARKETAI